MYAKGAENSPDGSHGKLSLDKQSGAALAEELEQTGQAAPAEPTPAEVAAAEATSAEHHTRWQDRLTGFFVHSAEAPAAEAAPAPDTAPDSPPIGAE